MTRPNYRGLENHASLRPQVAYKDLGKGKIRDPFFHITLNDSGSRAIHISKMVVQLQKLLKMEVFCHWAFPKGSSHKFAGRKI